MEDYPLSGEAANPQSFENHVIDKALGPIIILSSAPTAAIPQLVETQIGYYSGKLYFVIGGTLYSVTLTTVA